MEINVISAEPFARIDCESGLLRNHLPKLADFGTQNSKFVVQLLHYHGRDRILPPRDFIFQLVARPAEQIPGRHIKLIGNARYKRGRSELRSSLYNRKMLLGYAYFLGKLLLRKIPRLPVFPHVLTEHLLNLFFLGRIIAFSSFFFVHPEIIRRPIILKNF